MTDECKCAGGAMHLATSTVIVADYELLENKPQINSVELVGNKSLSDLGITGSSTGGSDLPIADDGDIDALFGGSGNQGGSGDGGPGNQGGSGEPVDGMPVATDEDIDALFD